MNEIHIQYYKVKGVEFILGSHDNKLCMLDFKDRKMRNRIDNRLKKVLKACYVEKDDVTLKETRKQLEEYFSLKRKSFDIPLLMLGTSFQKLVWEALLKVEYGQTLSYLELSKMIENEKAVRAVAIIIPCHRIIGSNGKLTGYAGGLDIKKRLLDLENKLFIS